MSARSHGFSQRRAELQLQCAAQRGQFVQSAAELGACFQVLDRGLSVARGLRIVPMLLTAASAAGVLSRAGGVIRLLSRVWMVVSTLQRLKRSRR
jgi:hypothetical protein